VELHEYDDSWVSAQIEKLKDLRRTRSHKDVTQSLKTLEQTARTGRNVMPVLVECCRSYATVGEITSVFRDVFGEWNEPRLF